jgi:serine-type D-Ala-D-Ala carboxypeptidase (penicillin-binding protein 5/6)
VGGSQLGGKGTIWNSAAGLRRPPSIQGSSYVIADADTGQVLAAKDPHGYFRPASTLKVLTAITLIPRLDPAKVVIPSDSAVNAEGSEVGISDDWKYTANQLFYGLLMQSGNDAAVALCEANGGVSATVAEMNAEAQHLQASDTIARTPDGLDDQPKLSLSQQRTSSYDLALMLREGLKLPGFRRYVGQELYNWPAPPTKKQRAKGKKVGGWEIQSHDHLILPYDRYTGMIGGKNGYTEAATGTFVGAAERGGHTIIAALMHSPLDFWGDERNLLDWGFAADGKVAPIGTLVSPLAPPSPSPTPRPVPAKKVRALVTTSPHTQPWALIALAGGLAIIVLAGGVTFGLRRRQVLAAAEPVAAAPVFTDVKVAGAPLTPADGAPADGE